MIAYILVDNLSKGISIIKYKFAMFAIRFAFTYLLRFVIIIKDPVQANKSETWEWTEKWNGKFVKVRNFSNTQDTLPKDNIIDSLKQILRNQTSSNIFNTVTPLRKGFVRIINGLVKGTQRVPSIAAHKYNRKYSDYAKFVGIEGGSRTSKKRKYRRSAKKVSKNVIQGGLFDKSQIVGLH
jgi:hypothetical protein